jgi:hypothetical protein
MLAIGGEMSDRNLVAVVIGPKSRSSTVVPEQPSVIVVVSFGAIEHERDDELVSIENKRRNKRHVRLRRAFVGGVGRFSRC